MIVSWSSNKDFDWIEGEGNIFCIFIIVIIIIIFGYLFFFHLLTKNQHVQMAESWIAKRAAVKSIQVLLYLLRLLTNLNVNRFCVKWIKTRTKSYNKTVSITKNSTLEVWDEKSSSSKPISRSKKVAWSEAVNFRVFINIWWSFLRFSIRFAPGLVDTKCPLWDFGCSFWMLFVGAIDFIALRASRVSGNH